MIIRDVEGEEVINMRIAKGIARIPMDWFLIPSNSQVKNMLGSWQFEQNRGVSVGLDCGRGTED
jgi:hypothetical protein